MKRKFLALLLIAIIAISLSACGRTETSNESNIEKEQEEIAEEEPEQAELEEEKSKEEPEEDRPLDIEVNGNLIYIMKILAAIEDNGFMQGFDYDLAFINRLYALEDNAIDLLIYYIGGEYGLPEGGRTEADGALFSVEQIQSIIYSLVGREVDLSSLANDNGWIEVYLRTDVLYTDCKNWNTEYIGNNTWKVYADVYSISPDGDGFYKKAEMTFTVNENPDSIFDGYSITEVDVTQPKMLEWAKAYYDYLLENYNNGNNRVFQYNLIYLDNDDIPEIYVYDESRNGDCLLYYSAGQINEEVLSVNYSYYQYIPKSGLLMEEIEYINTRKTVFQFINEDFKTILASVAYLKEEYQDEFIAENWMYDYSLNDEIVSEEEYNKRLDEAFDTSKAIKLRYDEDNALDFYSLLTYLTSLEDTE